MRVKLFLFLIAVFLIINVSALDLGNQERLDFGHVIVFSNLSTNPSTIEPGVPAVFNAILENTGNSFVNDVRVELELPEEIGFFNDVSKKKISKLLTGEIKSFKFNIIALPGSSEGVYKANLTADYVNHIGDERQDIYVIGIIVKSKPRMFVQIEESDVYKGNNVGDITVRFVNNDVADIKFLTVELLESEDYEILSNEKVYVGDLDSDDFESVDYRIKTNKKSGKILISLKITYKDSMNNPLTDEVAAVLTLHSGKDLGKVQSNTSRNVIILLIVVGGGYWYWRRWRKKKKRKIEKY